MRSQGWPRRHRAAIERGCLALYFLSGFLLTRGVLMLLFEGGQNQGFGVALSLIGAAIMVSALIARRHFDRQMNQPTPTYTPYAFLPVGPFIPVPAPIVFSRPLPTWGEPGALDDFEAYLRAQFAPALAQAQVAPGARVLYKLVDYLADLFEDAFPQHDVLAQVTFPRDWEISDFWHEEGDNILPNRDEAWLKLRRGESDLFEIAYQTFGADTTIVRLPVRSDPAKGGLQV